MMKTNSKTGKSSILLPVNYRQIVSRLKNRIRDARSRALLAVNTELLLVYWEIGSVILRQQREEGWGARVIVRLSADLQKEFPDLKGLSVRNLNYMRAFAAAFPDFSLQRNVETSMSAQQSAIMQQAAAQLPWGHIQVLLDKAMTPEQRAFYIRCCIENGWGRNILAEHIRSDHFGRRGGAITNFKETLPPALSDLAQQTFKNPYVFDFLSMGDKVREPELENALVRHLKSFMLELGKGFAYVGRQKNLVVEGDDFFLDLLFYNYHLHCFVVFELKVGAFKPAYAGTLNFYVNSINAKLKGPDDRSTIGVLLCKTPNETVVRYALMGLQSPIGVADYQLTLALPKQLKDEMPTVEELEAEIDKEYETLKSGNNWSAKKSR